MNIQELVEMLEAEIEDADDSICDMEDVIASAEADIEFIKGRRCLACGLLTHISGDCL